MEKEPDVEMNEILSTEVKWDPFEIVDPTFKKMYQFNMGIPFGSLTNGIDMLGCFHTAKDQSMSLVRYKAKHWLDYDLSNFSKCGYPMGECEICPFWNNIPMTSLNFRYAGEEYELGYTNLEEAKEKSDTR